MTDLYPYTVANVCGRKMIFRYFKSGAWYWAAHEAKRTGPLEYEPTSEFPAFSSGRGFDAAQEAKEDVYRWFFFAAQESSEASNE
jgi:hypothetical protein